jgi:SAM-dependent methyltransferase
MASIRKYWPLALISFLSVYLELVIIRWLASEVRIFAYFKNFPLLAAFLGFGVGCLIARRRRNYFRFTPLLLLALSVVIAFAWRGGYTHITFIDPYEQYLIGTFAFDNPLIQMLKGASFILGIFILTVAMFACLCEKLGECLNDFPPLTAYSVNVAFSLAGIVVYAGLCWASLGPAVWLAIAAIGLLAFFPRKLITVAPAFAAIALPIVMTSGTVLWSPYYRIDVKPMALAGADGVPHNLGYNVEVNHDAILGAYNFNADYVASLPADVRDQLLDYYNVSYRVFGPRFKKIAVLGAGAGNDVAAALRNGVEHIDAVEIDPGIIKVGRQFHAEAPYASEKVHIINGDARTFLRAKGNSDYDMIVFGALDSHAVFSSMSSVRIDNYVYTVESFSEALTHLGPNGILAVTFYCYKDWQLERVFNALWKANGAKPVVVYSLGAQRNNLVMLAGPGADRDALLAHPYVKAQNADALIGKGTVEPTTDDWPFLYLRERGLPFNYAYMLVLILGFSYMLVTRAAQVAKTAFDWPMFLLGAGFMLLETKVMAKIALLAGATWIVNTFVIAAVLVMILLANLAVMRGYFRDTRLTTMALALSILLDYVLKLNSLTLAPWPAVNLALVLALLALPIFFAGVLFASIYSGVELAAPALGYNLFGAMAGGVLEYFSMAWGINSLNLLSLVAYAGVAWLILRPRRVSAPALAKA